MDVAQHTQPQAQADPCKSRRQGSLASQCQLICWALCRDARKYSYKAVARWTKAVKLKLAGQGSFTSVLQFGRLVVPLNHQRSHWSCAVIDLANQEVLHLDSMQVWPPGSRR